MNGLPTNGLGTISQVELDLERILELIPEEHRGVLFERVMSNFAPETSSMLELGFALEWAKENTGGKDLLTSLLGTYEGDLRAYAVPKTEREWVVARLVAASIIQWLPTACGCSFLDIAFNRGGGSMSYTLPDPEKGMSPLPEPPHIVNEAPKATRPLSDEHGDDEDDDWPIT